MIDVLIGYLGACAVIGILLLASWISGRRKREETTLTVTNPGIPYMTIDSPNVLTYTNLKFQIWAGAIGIILTISLMGFVLYLEDVRHNTEMQQIEQRHKEVIKEQAYP